MTIKTLFIKHPNHPNNLKELSIAEKIIKAIIDNNYKHENIQNYFNNSEYKIEYNTYSGYVFAIDEDYNCLMLDDEKVNLLLSTPYDGHEGFIEELDDLYPEELNQEDIDYIKNWAKNLNYKLNSKWD